MRLAIVALVILFAPGVASSEDSGLEVDSGIRIYVLIEDLDEDAKAIGLTKELVAGRVELQLRRNGVPVGTREDSFASGVCLYVDCGIIGKAFALSIDFNRDVFYRVGDEVHSLTASAYNNGVLGTHDGNCRDVIQALTDIIDLFSENFLGTNQASKTPNRTDVGDGK